MEDNTFKDRGVGMLHLKAVDSDARKLQLLVRADNATGQLLLNIVVTSSTPLTRAGKNALTIVCVPNPPIKKAAAGDNNKPTSMLIRVKTSDDADQLRDFIVTRLEKD